MQDIVIILLKISPKTWDVLIFILQGIAALLMCADYWVKPHILKAFNAKIAENREGLKPDISLSIKITQEESRIKHFFKKSAKLTTYVVTLLFFAVWLLAPSFADALSFSAVALMMLLALLAAVSLLLFTFRSGIGAILHTTLNLIYIFSGAHKGAIFGWGALVLALSFVVRAVKLCIY